MIFIYAAAVFPFSKMSIKLCNADEIINSRLPLLTVLRKIYFSAYNQFISTTKKFSETAIPNQRAYGRSSSLRYTD